MIKEFPPSHFNIALKKWGQLEDVDEISLSAS
jgi:hypothetical protein